MIVRFKIANRKLLIANCIYRFRNSLFVRKNNSFDGPLSLWERGSRKYSSVDGPLSLWERVSRKYSSVDGPLSLWERVRVRAGVFNAFAVVIAAVLVHAAIIPFAAAAGDLDALAQKAVKDAVDRAAPSVAGVETIGGLEQVEGVSLGSAPTTGLIFDPDGYVVTSLFGLSGRPSSILVRLPDGTRKPAKLIAADHVRMLALLKIEVDKPLPTCEIAPSAEMRVGQWAIALGRSFDNGQPGISVGILSAKDRIWGKALQTDASVSPNNYGGPLVDIRGRVMGLIVPLSPESADEVAGYEWYDSGIGFAVPADHIEKILPRLKKGEDLRQGFVGVIMQSQNVYTSEPVIAAIRVKSPAAEAGLKSGDRIVEVAGRKISRSAEFREEIVRRYAGDKLELVVQRGKERLRRELTLAEKIPAYQRPYLGILPTRGGESGLKIRYVFPDSPAAKKGLIPGDAILAIDGKTVNKRDDLIEAMLERQPDQAVDLQIMREGKKESRKLILGGLILPPPPPTLPPAREKRESGKAKNPESGSIKLKIAGYADDAFAFVPENYDPKASYGLVVWLHGKGGLDWAKTVERWKPLCERYDLILAAPGSGETKKWMPGDVDKVKRLITQIDGKYNLDPLRVATHGYETGGALASLAALRSREIIRAMALVEATTIALPPENDPQYRFAVYLAAGGKSPAARSMKKTSSMLRDMNIPLLEISLGDDPRYLNEEELDELARWIDMLDLI
jgi:serine protease Do